MDGIAHARSEDACAEEKIAHAQKGAVDAWRKYQQFRTSFSRIKTNGHNAEIGILLLKQNERNFIKIFFQKHVIVYIEETSDYKTKNTIYIYLQYILS